MQAESEINQACGECGSTRRGCGPTRSECGPTRRECGPTRCECGPTQSGSGQTRSECGPTRSECGPTRSGCGPGHELCRVLWLAVVAVSGVILHPIRTLRHGAGLCSLAPYREVDRSSEVETDLSTTEEKQWNPKNAKERRKRKPTKRMKKKFKKGVQHYGNSATLCGSPIGSTCIARDIQQRISMSNYKYLEMRDVYVPSYGVFL